MPIRTDYDITTLSALNTMASYIGIPPITAITDIDTYPDIKLANEILDEITQATLAIGLPCNTDYEYPLTEVDGSGYVMIPAGAMICDIDDPQYTERDGLVYDYKTREFITDTNQTATIIWLQTFEDLPELVKRYIVTAASEHLLLELKVIKDYKA